MSAPDAVDRFTAEVRASVSATAVLQRRCPAATIRAAVDRETVSPAGDARRARLAVRPGQTVGYRRVRLMCGATLLSEAENWYVPDRLTPAMRTALAGDVPFGAVIRPLRPVRTILSVTRLGADPILQVGALVVGGDGTPLAEVSETYRRAVLRDE